MYKELYKMFKRTEKNICKLDSLYRHWSNFYIEKVINLFEYTGKPVEFSAGDKKPYNRFPVHELELRAILVGYCGVVNDPQGGLIVPDGGMNGVTVYSDYFTDYTYAAPSIKGGTVKIGVDAVVLRNTKTMLSLSSLIARYASLSAHTDISLKMALVNTRYQDVFKSASNSKMDTIKTWYKKLYEGEPAGILDETAMTGFDIEGDISALKLTTPSTMRLSDYTDLQNELLRNFFRDIGVKWNKDKKANVVEGEVTQDDQLLRFNVRNMFEMRKQFEKDFNDVFSEKFGELHVDYAPEFREVLEERREAEEIEIDEVEGVREVGEGE